MFYTQEKSDITLIHDPNVVFSFSFKFAVSSLYLLWEHRRLSCCLRMNFGTVYDAAQICQYVWCINNDYMQANGNVFHWSYRMGRFLRRTQVFTERFYCVRPHPPVRMRACTLACMRAWAKYRKVRTIFSSSSISPPSPMLRLFRPLFLPLASRSPEAKEARVLLRLTFSGMNYLARQVPVPTSRYCDFAIRRRNTRWEYALGVDDSGIVALSNW